MQRLAFVGVVMGLAAATMLAIAAAPLALFLAGYYAGGVWVEVSNVTDGTVTVTVHYNITVPLADLRADIYVLDGNRSVLLERHVERDVLQAGDSISINLDVESLSNAYYVRVYVEARIGGVYAFTVDYESPVRGGG